jgi:hypothetical protein
LSGLTSELGPSTCVAVAADAIWCLLQGELDELEREEFFRLKKVQKKKKKDEELRMEKAAAQVPSS